MGVRDGWLDGKIVYGWECQDGSNCFQNKRIYFDEYELKEYILMSMNFYVQFKLCRTVNNMLSMFLKRNNIVLMSLRH